MTMIIQAVEARVWGETFQLLNLLVRNLPIWHFQMLTGMGTYVRCLNLLTKCFMCNVWLSMKIRAIVPGVRIV